MQAGIIYNSPTSEFLTTLFIYGIILIAISIFVLIRKK
jgi:hypothetical protein